MSYSKDKMEGGEGMGRGEGRKRKGGEGVAYSRRLAPYKTWGRLCPHAPHVCSLYTGFFLCRTVSVNSDLSVMVAVCTIVNVVN